LHLLELEPLLSLGIGKVDLLLSLLSASHCLTDAKASAKDAKGDGDRFTHGSDPHKLMEQPTFCSEIGVRRDEGEPHPPQPFDMYQVTGICEIEKDLVAELDPIEMGSSFSQEPHGVESIADQSVGAQHPDGTDVGSLWHDAPHAHGPTVPPNHGHAGIASEETMEQGLLWRIA
jgi:hypothetical protein